MEKTFTMSDQFLAALMISLQKSLMEQSDIVPLLKSFKIAVENDELVVLNPPNSLAVEE